MATHAIRQVSLVGADSKKVFIWCTRNYVRACVEVEGSTRLNEGQLRNLGQFLQVRQTETEEPGQLQISVKSVSEQHQSIILAFKLNSSRLHSCDLIFTLGQSVFAITGLWPHSRAPESTGLSALNESLTQATYSKTECEDLIFNSAGCTHLMTQAFFNSLWDDDVGAGVQSCALRQFGELIDQLIEMLKPQRTKKERKRSVSPMAVQAAQARSCEVNTQASPTTSPRKRKADSVLQDIPLPKKPVIHTPPNVSLPSPFHVDEITPKVALCSSDPTQDLVEKLTLECTQWRKKCEEEQARAQELEKENAMLRGELTQGRKSFVLEEPELSFSYSAVFQQVDPHAAQGEQVRSMMQFLPNKPDSAMRLLDFTNETVSCSQVEEEMVKSFFADCNGGYPG